jgi:hypothetical protein
VSIIKLSAARSTIAPGRESGSASYARNCIALGRWQAWLSRCLSTWPGSAFSSADFTRSFKTESLRTTRGRHRSRPALDLRIGSDTTSSRALYFPLLPFIHQIEPGGPHPPDVPPSGAIETPGSRLRLGFRFLWDATRRASLPANARPFTRGSIEPP